VSAVTAIAAAPAVRERACPLCETPAGQPCQDKPAGDHLARYLDAFTAGQLTRLYMTMVLAELVVLDTCAIVTEVAR
jgi:hypothetical protein